jgi:hypothetical protein
VLDEVARSSGLKFPVFAGKIPAFRGPRDLEVVEGCGGLSQNSGLPGKGLPAPDRRIDTDADHIESIVPVAVVADPS